MLYTHIYTRPRILVELDTSNNNIKKYQIIG